jgi:hypothetical protein
MKELTNEQIEEIFINFADESVNDELHLSLYAFKEAINEAINYTRCCEELCDCKKLPKGEIAISSKALTDPNWES